MLCTPGQCPTHKHPLQARPEGCSRARTGTTCNQRIERIEGTEHAKILRVPFRSKAGILRKWISRRALPVTCRAWCPSCNRGAPDPESVCACVARAVAARPAPWACGLPRSWGECVDISAHHALRRSFTSPSFHATSLSVCMLAGCQCLCSQSSVVLHDKPPFILHASDFITSICPADLRSYPHLEQSVLDIMREGQGE